MNHVPVLCDFLKVQRYREPNTNKNKNDTTGTQGFGWISLTKQQQNNNQLSSGLHQQDSKGFLSHLTDEITNSCKLNLHGSLHSSRMWAIMKQPQKDRTQTCTGRKHRDCLLFVLFSSSMFVFNVFLSLRNSPFDSSAEVIIIRLYYPLGLRYAQ